MPTISKWGNSLGLRLSKSVAEEAGIEVGTTVGVRLLDNGSLLITPILKTVKVDGEQSLEIAARPIGKW
jgi:antitoxin component of MazEF toxin-antitoxin module